MVRESSQESDESEEITLAYLLTFTKEYLAQGLLKYVKFEQYNISKIKALRKGNKVLKLENETL